VSRLPCRACADNAKSVFLVGVLLCLSSFSLSQIQPAGKESNDAILSRPLDRVTGHVDAYPPDREKSSIAITAPLKIVHQLPVVSICINGRGPYDLLVDTGTESTLVDKELAADLQLLIQDRTQLMTPNGMRPVMRAFGNIVLGSRNLTNTEFLVDDLHELHALSPRLRGILGKNVLIQFNFLLDYRHHRVELQPIAEEQSGLQVPFDLIDGRIILTVELPGAQKMRLQLDSGATHTLLFQPVSPAGQQRVENALLSTNAGTTGVQEMRIRELRLGNTVLRDVQAGLVSPAGAPGIDGLLPTNLFDSVYFDFAGRFIWVTGNRILSETADKPAAK
jgi:predicted aspartyl protease